jgi:branched-subunit amino acid transport protein
MSDNLIVSSWGTWQGWLAIAGLSLGTFAIRYSFIGLLAGKKLPPRLERGLQLAVPAIFAALVLPLIVLSAGQFDMAVRWPHMVAALVTGGYAWWRGGLLVSIALGMGTLHGLLWWMNGAML